MRNTTRISSEPPVEASTGSTVAVPLDILSVLARISADFVKEWGEAAADDELEAALAADRLVRAAVR